MSTSVSLFLPLRLRFQCGRLLDRGRPFIVASSAIEEQ
jgi:hypothetical protein